jgi:hypothetical protein
LQAAVAKPPQPQIRHPCAPYRHSHTESRFASRINQDV